MMLTYYSITVISDTAIIPVFSVGVHRESCGRFNIFGVRKTVTNQGYNFPLTVKSWQCSQG